MSDVRFPAINGIVKGKPTPVVDLEGWLQAAQTAHMNPLRCPHCGSERQQLISTRAIGLGIRRNRQCDHCGSSFSTVEVENPVPDRENGDAAI